MWNVHKYEKCQCFIHFSNTLRLQSILYIKWIDWQVDNAAGNAINKKAENIWTSLEICFDCRGGFAQIITVYECVIACLHIESIWATI